MPYHVLDTFTRGVDRRRPEFAALPGTLYVGDDVHVSRGGTLQVRKKFVEKYTLPAGRTFGFARASDKFYVFGHETPGTLTVPSGITYQQLEHPGTIPMVQILSAHVFDGKVYAVALYQDGAIYHFYDGVRITDMPDARARGFFRVLTGSTGAGNKVTSVKVNGVEVLGADVAWTTSHADTAAAIAAQINSYSSTPNYTAVSENAVVYVIAPTGTGAEYNDLTVQVAVAGDLTVTDPQDMYQGVDVDVNAGPFAFTYGKKVYALSGPLLAISGINKPTKFNDAEVGSGIINLSNHAAGSEDLIGAAEYLGYVIFWSRETAQIWSLDADPEQNSVVQIIGNAGTRAPRANAPLGESDVLYLSSSGIRSIHPSFTTANTHVSEDFSSAIAPLILEDLRTLSDADIAKAVGTVEPQERRVLFALGTKVYVLSYFPAERITAFSVYNPGFQITEWVTANDRLYCRAGNTIYLYGGDSGVEYDDTLQPHIRITGVHAAAPATFKGFIGLDVGAIGEWDASIIHGLDDDTAEIVATTTRPTFDEPSIPIQSVGTHLTLDLVGRASARELVNVVLHFVNHEAD